MEYVEVELAAAVHIDHEFVQEARIAIFIYSLSAPDGQLVNVQVDVGAQHERARLKSGGEIGRLEVLRFDYFYFGSAVEYATLIHVAFTNCFG